MNAIIGFDLKGYVRDDVSSIRLGAESLPVGVAGIIRQFAWEHSQEERKLVGSKRADGVALDKQEIGMVAADRVFRASIDGVAKKWRKDHDADPNGFFASQVKEALNLQKRADDYAGGSGFALPLANAFVFRPLLDEPLPEQTSFAFLKTRPVDAWKDYYIIGRRKHAGQAAFWNSGNTGIPVANSSANYEQHPLYTIVTSYQVDLIYENKLSSQGIDKMMMDRESAYYALRQLMNYTNFSGNDALALPGILNYPGQAQITSTQVFNSAASAETLLGLLTTWMTYNFGVMAGISSLAPNHVRFSPKLWALLASKNFTSYQNNGRTVLDVLIDTQRRIMEGMGRTLTFGVSPELEGAGPNGQSGILFMNDSLDSAAYVNPMQIAELPPQVSGFTSTHIVFGRYGGFAAPNAAANLIVWVPLV